MELAGQLLVAMPGMGDARFAHSVVFLCAYSDEGAMGLIVNKPVKDATLSDVLERLDLPPAPQMRPAPVHFGGPVETDRGFVLHGADEGGLSPSLDVVGGFAVTGTKDILGQIATGAGPAQYLFALGYAGWSAGQLDSEITDNGWLTAPATAELLFDTPDAEKWDAALRSIGIDPISLSAASGRA